MDLVIARPEGLYCPPGDFYIDPWRPVDRAVITHGHGDHARVGNRHYLTAASGAGILRSRLGQDIHLQTLPYGERLLHHGVTLSLHPAGHVLGSAQVRLEYQGEVWVASGDYKVEPDGTCTPFEPVRCHTFISESTFGLPIYRWTPTLARSSCMVLSNHSTGFTGTLASTFRKPAMSAISLATTRCCARHWSWHRLRRVAAVGCAVSATTAMPLPVAGCCCAAPDAGVG